MMTENQKPNKPKRRLMKVVLVVSLGFNVLVLGLVGGAFIRGGPPDHIRPDRGVAALGLRAYFRALDDNGQQGLRAGIKANRDNIHAGRDVFRAHLKALSQALAAEPYDAGAVSDLLIGQANIVADNISVGHRLLLEQIAQMTPEARKEMAAQLLSPLKPPRRP
jgi:uncharacterized membrane protein